MPLITTIKKILKNKKEQPSSKGWALTNTPEDPELIKKEKEIDDNIKKYGGHGGISKERGIYWETPGPLTRDGKKPIEFEGDVVSPGNIKKQDETKKSNDSFYYKKVGEGKVEKMKK